LVGEGRLVATEELEERAAFPDAIHGGVAGVLEHDVIPFVSYPYEWSFEMLRDAALLQLGILRRALESGMVLKDSTPYNVQFRGAAPVFIDVGSFEPLREGEPWAGYRQFCMLFLYPLLLQAWKDVPFQPWLRGSLNGITPQEIRNLLSLRDRFRRGTLTHVVLHARLEQRYEEKEADAAVVDRLCRKLRDENDRKILPLNVNIVDPPPALGWSGSERQHLPKRGRPDLTLCLALIHHVSIGGNVPVAEFLEWLRVNTGSLVIEWVAPEDPMAHRLLARKGPGEHPDYRPDWFERCLAER